MKMNMNNADPMSTTETSCFFFRYGVAPGSNVALLVVPSAEFTLLQLAIIKLGAVVSPKREAAHCRLKLLV